MSAGKSCNYPPPGTHEKCRKCPISLVCLSGRRRMGRRTWCQHCRGVHYKALGVTVRCVVFRGKRGRYREKFPRCPACGEPHWNVKGTGNIVKGITHEDAEAWRQEQRRNHERKDTRPSATQSSRDNDADEASPNRLRGSLRSQGRVTSRNARTAS